MSTKVKRSNIASFLNVNPTGTASYQLLGDGVTTALINMNPNITTETYIHQDTASISVDSYAPTVPIEMTCVNGDGVFEFVDALRKARSVLGDAETQIVHVWKYETIVSGSMYPAEKQTVAIAIDSIGGDGGTPAKLNFTINYVGAHTVGHYHLASGTFL